MPSTNQTDLAGREWRTTLGNRAHWREHPQHCADSLVIAILDDLETALAKIEALEGENASLEAAGIEALERAAEAEARVNALEGALRPFANAYIAGSFTDEQRCDFAVSVRVGDFRRARALFHPDPAEQPEAGR
jgi:hypothetical protein